MTEKKESMAALSIPREYIPFIQANPKLAERVGAITYRLIELLQLKKTLEEIITNTDVFLPFVEKGTKEELEGFLKAVVAGADKSFVATDVPEGFHDEFHEKMREKDPNVQVVTTLIEEKTPESKEA